MRIFLLFFTTFVLFGIDFFLKNFFHWPFQNIALNSDLNGYFPIIGDIFGIQLTYNYWIAFGIQITGIFLQILTILIIAFLIFYYIKNEFSKKNFWMDFAFVLVFAGAFSHWYERLFVGYVIDYLSLKNFAIFNFADILITIWGIIIIFYSFFYERDEQ